jgi:hypothetical protein
MNYPQGAAPREAALATTRRRGDDNCSKLPRLVRAQVHPA